MVVCLPCKKVVRVQFLPAALMKYKEFVRRYCDGSQPTAAQQEAIKMFLLGHSSLLWQAGRGGGKTWVRDAITRYLEDEERQEYMGKCQ